MSHPQALPYPLALALTLLIEVPIYGYVLRGARGWLIGVAVNLVTHPAVWWVLSRAGSAYPGWFVTMETIACVVEFALLWAIIRRDAALLALTALVANAGSALVGLVVVTI